MKVLQIKHKTYSLAQKELLYKSKEEITEYKNKCKLAPLKSFVHCP
jgi:hypothetical protein